MSEHAVAQQQTTNTLQRITSNALNFQRQAVNHDEPTALPELKGDTLSGDCAESRLGFDFSGVPAFTGMAQQARSLLRTQPMVQRFPEDGASGSSSCPTCSEAESEQISTTSEPTAEAAAPALEATPTPVPSEPTEEPAEEMVTAEEVALPGLIVEDSITELSAGQMKKSEFLNQLRAEVCRTIEAALVDTGRTTEDCPYLNYWFDFYGQKNSTHIERVIHRYAPNASNVTSATGYIPVITQRARQAAETWARTGEITGVPEGVPTTVPGEAPAESGEGAATSSSPVMFKAREGGARSADDPQAIQRELGEGRLLDSGVRSRMGSAFGTDFSHVRIHADNKASELSNGFNARAFTVGEHVAFGATEYRPGTLIGDALIAHELAHVVQQGNASPSVSSKPVGTMGFSTLEKDADLSAVSAMVSLWGGVKGIPGYITEKALPRLRSGLRLQRCGPSLPPLRDPQTVLGESRSFEQKALANIRQRRITGDRDQESAIDTAERDLQNALLFLRQIYQDELEDAGTDIRRQREAQGRFEEQVQRLRESYMLQFDLSRRYGVAFTVGISEASFQRTGTTIIRRWRLQAWSREELETVDRILRRVPPRYMQNFRTRVLEIRRKPLNGGAASWDDSAGRLTIYDRAFEYPDQLNRIILHEIGHSTVQERTVNSFPHLPPHDWMRLSDWRMFTREDIESALGLRNADERREVLERLDENARLVQQYERPIPIDTPVERRWVVNDKYEGLAVFPPTRFFHFGDDHREEFVSGYAKSHPAEDLAESFAHFLLNPDATRRKLDVGRRGAMDKWDFLVRNYPERLIRRKSKVSQFRDRNEREADKMAEAVMDATVREGLSGYEKRPDLTFTDRGIQRQPTSETPTSVSAPVAAESSAIHIPEITSARVLIVEDETEDLEVGQMRKGRLLAELRTAVCSAADSVLEGTDRSTDECPYLSRWFNYYRERTPQQVEQAIHRYAPDTRRVSSAREYIPIITERVSHSVDRWAQTGEITGLPEGMAPGLLSMGLSGIAGSLLSGIASFGASLVQGSGRLFSGISGIFFKSRNSDTEEVDNPDVIQTELGEGQSLDSGIRSRMESAFGMNFSHVRIHTDSSAAILSDRFNARAFTLGKHIAFGSGEYRPYTPVGDALIAHEMAHVVQQGAATSSSTPMAKNAAKENSLEEEADLFAINVVTSLLSGVNGKISQIRTSALPRLKAGLKLQRCATTRSEVRVQVQSLTDLASITPWQLSQVSDEQFNRLSGSRTRSGEPGIEDYRRARQLVRAVFRAYNVTFDIDNPPSTPLGREPTPRELRILDANLTQILASGGGNIRRLVSGPGGRGVPTHGTSRTPTLEGRVRITRTLGEFVAKRYQLETLISSGLRQNTTLLDSEVAVLWRQFGIQPGSSPHITDQERRVATFKLLEASAAGFYHPPDDIIYFPPTVNLSMPATRDIARHETAHLLGGRERTRQAFIRRFGTANYMHYWEPFEEGMAELITQESRPVGQRVPSSTIATSRSGSTIVTVEAGGSQYEQYVQWIRRLIALHSRNRNLLLQAFFTGNIPETIFSLLIRNPPPAR
jgi:hypothetical protein